MPVQKRLLDSAESWDFASSNTQNATHGMHTWLAAMIPPLARKLIDTTKPKALLDPFCGGGSVCVEGVLQGCRTAGVEINPLGVIVTKAKTTYIERRLLEQSLKDILSAASEYNGPDLLYPDRAKSFLVHYWYKPYMLRPLSALANAINSVDREDVRTLYQCVLSATARDVSLTYRNEIRLRRLEPDKFRAFNPKVMDRFLLRAHDSIQRVQKLPEHATATVILGSVLSLPFDCDQFTTIICSPPYGDERNGVPYFQFAKNMLYWLGWDRKDLLKRKAQTLGWVGARRDIECPDSGTLAKVIRNMGRGKRPALEAVAFYRDYFEALKEMVRVTSEKIAIVVGNRVLNKNLIDNGKITTELLERLGVRLETHHTRTLPSKRLPRLTSYGGGGIDKEHILIYDVSSKNV